LVQIWRRIAWKAGAAVLAGYLDWELDGLTTRLTKRDLVLRISAETGLIQTQVIEVVQKILDHIAESLANGDNVELRNFGVFEVRIAKARTGRNPHKPEIDVAVPSRAMVKFKAGKEMRAEVLKLTPNKAAIHVLTSR